MLKARMISDHEKIKLLKLHPDEITYELIESLFADRFINNKIELAVYQPYDKMKLKKGEYFNNSDIVTTVGSFLYNKFIIEPHFVKILGYVDQTLNKKEIGKLEDKLSKALVNDEITTEQFADYINRDQWLKMSVQHIFNGSFTEKTIKHLPSVKKEKERLFKENKKAIEDGDPVVVNKIESQLLNLARNELKDDIGMDMYESGARGSFENNYKHSYVMKGAFFNTNENKYEVVKNCLVEGIDKKNLTDYGTMVINGAYPKAVGVRNSGYMVKQFFAAFQAIQLDEKGTDCKTKMYKEFKITEENKERVLYRYIIVNKKLILLNEKNINEYVNKMVNMRRPLYCIGDKLCNICVGDIYYKLGIRNIGLTTTKIGSIILNHGMKAFHDANVKIGKLKVNELVL